MRAVLMLEDGKSFAGKTRFGGKDSIGEVILNTAVVGYQEMITDPTNAGKILVLTYPLIGNYGCAPKFNESNRAWLCGLAIKEETRIFSNWQAKTSFGDFVKEQGLFTISNLDTRSLAVHLRQKGQMMGIISSKDFETKELLSKLEAFHKKTKESLLPEISLKKPKMLSKGKAKHRIAILDLGITNSIIRQLETLGVAMAIMPYNSTADDILRLKPWGLIISNGPEEDVGLEAVAENVKALINKLPILGIATGHQVLARALGAKVKKMKIGHHGANYPLLNPASYRGEITVQNHSLVVDADSLSEIKNVKITGFNLNDRSVEEIESKKLKLLGVQYMPLSPGFNEVNGAFKKFMKILGGNR
jgi:carbamoyl-phosphate synthase small subunit